MRKSIIVLVAALALLALPATAQETPGPMVDAYEALAETILAVRSAEATFVRALLDGHYHAAEQLAENGDWAGAAAYMALFASEGDNAIAGVRKRLLEGGHHFDAAGEEQGLFEEGYVIVSREAKTSMLEAVSKLRQATDDEARKMAWAGFEKVARKLLDED